VRPALLVAGALFFLYAVWAAALQGLLASPHGLGPWTPDLGLLLLFAWAGKLRGARGPLAALAVGLARASFAADPPVALAAAALGALGLFALLRTTFEVDRAVPRAVLCGLCAWLTARFLVAGHAFALAADGPAVRLDPQDLWPGALASAVACLALAPLCARLPGLAPLARTRP
jgi:hypothetical protein